MGGGSQQQTQTTSTQLSPEQQQLISMGMGPATSFAQAGGVTLPGSPIAGFNPNQTAGQNMALNAAGGQAPIVGNAGAGNQFFTTGAALDPNTNPGLRSAISFAEEPIKQNFMETVLPSIGKDAVGAGGYGGSREGIAEGLAARGEEQAIGTTAANLTNQNYLNALDQMTKNIALAPSIAGAQTIPALTTSGVGDVQQALQQAMNTYGWQSNVFQQEQPITIAQELMGLGAGIPGGSTTSTGSVTSEMSPLQMALGAAGIGSSLFGGKSGMFPGALSSVGSGLGSALSGIGSGVGDMFAGLGGGMSSLLPFLMA